MIPLVLHIQSYIRAQQLLTPGTRVLVAISGGPDSVFLAYTLRTLGYPIGLAHVNYQLRGEDSEAEEQLVRQYAQAWQVPVYVSKKDTYDLLKGNKHSLQTLAREIRYQFFEEIMTAEGYAFCATAHHADDQVESILLSLLRGSPSPTFSPIPTRRGPYIRPLLTCQKAEILNAVHTLGLKYGIDRSNRESLYLRNQMRNEVIPFLSQYAPSLPSQLLAKVENYRSDHHLLEALLAPWHQRCEQIPFQLDWTHFEEAMGAQHLSAFVRYVLIQWGLHGHRLQEALHLISSQSGKFINTDLGRLVRTRKGLELIQIEAFTGASISFEDFPLDQSLNFMGHRLSLRFPDEKKPDFSQSTDFYFDLDKFHFPLIFRTWQEGDKMIPLGMKTHKKISDIFIDEKYGHTQKKKAIIVEANQEIICLLGFRISENVKLTAQSKRWGKISVLPSE